VGWASGPDPTWYNNYSFFFLLNTAGPTWLVAQASNLADSLSACVHELFTHACYNNCVIKMQGGNKTHLASCYRRCSWRRYEGMQKSSLLVISASITSIIGGFNLLYIFLVGFVLSSNSMWCIHIEGLMPLMSAKVHPMVVLWSHNNFTSFSSCVFVKPVAMITGSVLLSPMNTYFKLSGKGFNFNLGACKIDGKSFLCESIKSIKTLPWGTVCKACKTNADSCTF